MSICGIIKLEKNNATTGVTNGLGYVAAVTSLLHKLHLSKTFLNSCFNIVKDPSTNMNIK